MHMDGAFFFFFRGENKFVGNIWHPRHDTRPRNTHMPTHIHIRTVSIFKVRVIHTRARAHAKASLEFFFFFFVQELEWWILAACVVLVGISLNLLSLFSPFAKVCVCVRRRARAGGCVCFAGDYFQADGGSHCPPGRVSRDELTSTDCRTSSSCPPFPDSHPPQRPPRPQRSHFLLIYSFFFPISFSAKMNWIKKKRQNVNVS